MLLKISIPTKSGSTFTSIKIDDNNDEVVVDDEFQLPAFWVLDINNL